MCGCSGSVSSASSYKYSSSSSKSITGSCSGYLSKLMDARNKLAIMHNLETDVEKKEEYKTQRDEIDGLISQITSTGVCPEYSIILFIVNEVNNEHSKYSN